MGLAAWRASTSQAFVPLDIHPLGGEEFHGRLASAQRGGLSVFQLEHTAAVVARTPQLIPEARATLAADPQATVTGRATFATEHLWVTSHDAEEVFPAGMYPNQHAEGAGLPAFVERGGEVDGADLVVWLSFGLTHIPRPEDWPVMPVDYAGFWLKPYGFLDRNPAIDLPGSGQGEDGSCCAADGVGAGRAADGVGAAGSCCAGGGETG